MAREKGSWSSVSYESTVRSIERSDRKSVTGLGEQRAEKGQGLDPLVDPKTHGVLREALNLLLPEDDGTFILSSGVAIPEKTVLDCTGSMGGNVEIAFHSIPRNQFYLVQSPRAILNRYHAQLATAVIQDVCDKFPHQHTEFEPDNEIDRQMRMLVPERNGGDETEDYQLDLWYTAQRIKTSIELYGLKGYYFIVGDEIGRKSLDGVTVRKQYGLEGIQEISVEELGSEVLKKWHAFYLQVGQKDYTTKYWSRILGQERVIILPETEDIAEVQSIICGLTEGVIDLQNAAEYLIELSQSGSAEHRINKGKAKEIVRAVSHIPLRAQADLPNFDRIPLVGSVFASREDIWPISMAENANNQSKSEEIDWQL